MAARAMMSTKATGERPILFSGPMVRAILDGKKTQTRRVLTPQPLPGHTIVGTYTDGAYGIRCPYGAPGDRLWVRETWQANFGFTFRDNPEAWWHEVPRSLRTRKAVERFYFKADGSCYYNPENPRLGNGAEDGEEPLPWEAHRSDVGVEGDGSNVRWRPSIHMPRWASRLTLEVVDVRVERLQEITEEDAQAEGVTAPWMGHDRWDYRGPHTHREAFARVWETINGKRAPWGSNPWVWAVSFRRIDA